MQKLLDMHRCVSRHHALSQANQCAQVDHACDLRWVGEGSAEGGGRGMVWSRRLISQASWSLLLLA
jgi:hypothetical protein